MREIENIKTGENDIPVRDDDDDDDTSGRTCCY